MITPVIHRRISDNADEKAGLSGNSLLPSLVVGSSISQPNKSKRGYQK
jgi:hypothetical protein